MERTKFSCGFQYNPREEPLIFPQLTTQILLSSDEPDNTLCLFHLYYYTAKYQQTDVPVASTAYISEILGWNPDKVRRVKKLLINLGLAKESITYNDKGQVTSHSLKINLGDPYESQTPLSDFGRGNENNLAIIYNDLKKKEKVIPPQLEWVRDYCTKRKNDVDPETFFDFYQSKGWMIGKNKMRDWHAAIHTWEKNSKNEKTSQPYGKKPYIIDDGIKYFLSPDGQYRNHGGEIFIE